MTVFTFPTTDASNLKASNTEHDMRPNARIEALLREVRGPEILHVGCVGHKVAESAAELAHFFHHQLCLSFAGGNVLGIDIDRVGLARMEAMGFRVAIGDAQNLNFNSRFDTIVAGELIEHLQNPGAFLQGVARGLKPGGRLVLSTPNVFSVMLNLMFWKNSDHAFNPEHALWFCPQTLREILRRCGFLIDKLEFVDDLEPNLSPSRWYHAFARVWMATHSVVPTRFRNTMVAVCRLA
ncbi:MAG: methyltransferase domain-containing protein [Candidatus Acidiferrales bacterium]